MGDDFDWGFVSVDGLSVTVAWALATAWLPQFQGLVGLGVDHSRAKLRTVPTYEWVKVRFPYHYPIQDCERFALTARAACLVWRALASCRGFGVQEHPVFWKRLLDETQHHAEDSPHWQSLYKWEGVTDEKRLFDDVAFPRFKLIVPQEFEPDTMERILRVYCGLEHPDAELADASDISIELKTILDRLEPMIQVTRMGPVELALDLQPVNTEETQINRLVRAIEANHPSLVVSNQEDAPLDTMLLSPPFVVNMVSLSDFWVPKCRQKKTEWTLQRGHGLQTTLVKRTISAEWMWKPNGRAVFRSFLHWSLRLHGSFHSGAGVRHLDYRHLSNEHSIAAICSALPHSRSLETWQLTSNDDSRNHLDAVDLAWICYALFHPDAEASTWRQLVVTNLCYTCRSGSPRQRLDDACDAMARGNNLHVVLGHGEDRVDRYYTATIRKGAQVHEAPGKYKKVVHVLETATVMDVCVTSTDMSQLNEWVFVVLVGYGEAWVQSRWIDEIVPRPPGRGVITGLLVDEPRSRSDGAVGGDGAMTRPLFQLVKVVGHMLENLRVGDCLAFGGMCEMIRDWCPRLQSLALKCTYADVSSLELPPTLRHLELCLPLDSSKLIELEFAEPFLHQVPDLVSLRIETYRLPTDTEVTKFVRPLLRFSPTFRRFFWIDRTADSGRMRYKTTYVANRLITRSTFQQLDFGRDDIAAVGYTPVTTIVAFLSVVEQRRREESAMRLLNREIIGVIANFACEHVKRDLWVIGGRHAMQTPCTPDATM